jgi:hypothetical protein
MNRHAGTAYAECSLALDRRFLSRAICTVVVGAASLACGSRTNANETRDSTRADETVLVPECRDYAQAFRACVERTGVPAPSALAAIESRARVPASLAAAERDLRATSCVNARAVLASTCR